MSGFNISSVIDYNIVLHRLTSRHTGQPNNYYLLCTQPLDCSTIVSSVFNGVGGSLIIGGQEG